MITVYHNKNFLDYSLMTYKTENHILKSAVLTEVAEIDTKNLEVAFLLTNNIDSSWAENKKIKVFGNNQRSTSVGDVFKILDKAEDEFYVVEAMGFRKLIPEEVCGLTFFAPLKI